MPEPAPRPEGAAAPGGDPVVDLSGEELLRLFTVRPQDLTDRELNQLVTRLEGLRTQVTVRVAEVQAVWDGPRASWRSVAGRTGRSWLVSRTGISGGAATRSLALAHDLADRPRLRQAMWSADLGEQIVRELLKARIGMEAPFDRDEAMLVQTLTGLRFSAQRKVIARWLQLAREELGENEDDGPAPDPEDQNRLVTSRGLDGRMLGEFNLDPVSASALEAAINAYLDMEFRSGTSPAPGGSAGPDGSETPTAQGPNAAGRHPVLGDHGDTGDHGDLQDDGCADDQFGDATDRSPGSGLRCTAQQRAEALIALVQAGAAATCGSKRAAVLVHWNARDLLHLRHNTASSCYLTAAPDEQTERAASPTTGPPTADGAPERAPDGAPGRPAEREPIASVAELVQVHRELDGGWPLDRSDAERLLCDAEVRHLIKTINADGLVSVHEVGGTHRTATPRQRLALNERDRGCVVPGCTVPVAWCEAHHIVDYEISRTTNLDDLALVCSAHHHQHHRGELTITGSAGDFTVTLADGSILEACPPERLHPDRGDPSGRGWAAA